METVYVVLSRDRDFVFVTKDNEKAVKAQQDQTKDEEMAGGRPSVYIRITTLQ